MRYRYEISNYLTINSEFKLFLLDNSEPVTHTKGDILLVEEPNQSKSVECEWDNDQFVIRVTPHFRWCIDKNERHGTCSTAKFTEVLLTAIECRLLQQHATLAFAGAVKSPEGKGVLVFGESNSGKSSLIFALCRNHGYELLADDLVIIHGGKTNPFPRFVDMSLDVPSLEKEIKLVAERFPKEIHRWESSSNHFDSEVSIPRTRVSSTIPKYIDSDYAFFLSSKRKRWKKWIKAPTEKITSANLWNKVEGPNQNHADKWWSHSVVRGHFPELPHHRQIIKGAFEEIDCYSVHCSKSSTVKEILKIF